MKELVKIREKKSERTGISSLYLDYTVNGERRRDFLGLYLSPGKDAKTRQNNKVVMESARILQAKKIADLIDGKTGRVKSSTTPVLQLIIQYEETHSHSKGYSKGLSGLRNHFTAIFGEKKPVGALTKEDMLKFAKDLSIRMNGGSGYKYYNQLSMILEKAVRDGLIEKNPAKLLDRSEKPQNKKAEREYLTMDEVRTLASTECNDDLLKKAFLFSCFTGLRLSDVRQLEWSMIKNGQIEKRMEKTDEIVYVPLSENALSVLPAHTGDLVYKFKSERQMSRDLKEWISRAGITKKITFHSARHTFATLGLTYGADLATISSLLGHKNIATTLIYARIVDEKKKAAVNLIPKL